MNVNKNKQKQREISSDTNEKRRVLKRTLHAFDVILLLTTSKKVFSFVDSVSESTILI